MKRNATSAQLPKRGFTPCGEKDRVQWLFGQNTDRGGGKGGLRDMKSTWEYNHVFNTYDIGCGGWGVGTGSMSSDICDL